MWLYYSNSSSSSSIIIIIIIHLYSNLQHDVTSRIITTTNSFVSSFPIVVQQLYQYRYPQQYYHLPPPHQPRPSHFSLWSFNKSKKKRNVHNHRVVQLLPVVPLGSIFQTHCSIMNHLDIDGNDKNDMDDDDDDDVTIMTVRQKGIMGTLYQVQLTTTTKQNQAQPDHTRTNGRNLNNNTKVHRHREDDDDDDTYNQYPYERWLELSNLTKNNKVTIITEEQSSIPIQLPPLLHNNNNNNNNYHTKQKKNDDHHYHYKILCLYRYKLWWYRPIWVNHIHDIPYETSMILFQQPSKSQPQSTTTNHTTTFGITYHLYLAVPLPVYSSSNITIDTNKTVVSYTSSSLRSSRSAGNDTNPDNRSSNNNHSQNNDQIILCSDHPTTGLYIGSTVCSNNNDIYALIQEGVQMASDVWRQQQQQQQQRLRTSHPSLQLQSQQPISTLTQINEMVDRHDHTTGNERSIQNYNAGNTMHTTLGWCTWNAMETNVTDRNIMNALQKLLIQNDDDDDYKIPIRWMIIDDGWQDTTSDAYAGIVSPRSNDDYNGLHHHTLRLQSLHEDTTKFNNTSLLGTIQLIKQQFPMIGTVLIWHALHGYWLGLQETIIPNTTTTVHTDVSTRTTTSTTTTTTNTPTADMIQSQLYYPKFPIGIVHNDPSSMREASVGLGVGIPNDIDHFYERYYNTLIQDNQIDGVKVDVQAITSILYRSNSGNKNETVSDHIFQPSPSILLHTALAANVLKNFVDASKPQSIVSSISDKFKVIQQIIPAIHCMAHSPEIFYRLPSLYEINSTTTTTASFFRVADDYYPNNDASHGAQIVACAYNTLLFGHLERVIPDWDMFTTTLSDERYVRMHAIARCISGGPIYISNNPLTGNNNNNNNNNNNKIFEWIACNDGTTFPCRQGGLPTTSSLFIDPLEAGDSMQQHQPLIIWNTNGDDTMITSGIFGIFYLNGSGDWDTTKLDYVNNRNDTDCTIDPLNRITASICPIDIPNFGTNDLSTTLGVTSSFVALCFFDKSVTLMTSPYDRMTVTLQHLQSESVSMIPIRHITTIANEHDDNTRRRTIQIEYIVLGIRGKINGVGAVSRIDTYRTDHGTHRIVIPNVKGCGEFVMAFRWNLDRDVDGVVYHPMPVINVQINDMVLRQDQLRWNRRRSPNDNNHTKNRRDTDAIDSLLELDFDLLSFTCPSLNHTITKSCTIEIHI